MSLQGFIFYHLIVVPYFIFCSYSHFVIFIGWMSLCLYTVQETLVMHVPRESMVLSSALQAHEHSPVIIFALHKECQLIDHPNAFGRFLILHRFGQANKQVRLNVVYEPNLFCRNICHKCVRMQDSAQKKTFSSISAYLFHYALILLTGIADVTNLTRLTLSVCVFGLQSPIIS